MSATMTHPGGAMTDSELREAVIAACRALTQRGLTHGTSGNVSVRRDELDSDGVRLDHTLVSDDVHVASAGIDKPHSCCVHVGRAVGIVTVIGRHRSSRDDDQAMARVSVPAGASAGLPDVVLHVHV